MGRKKRKSAKLQFECCICENTYRLDVFTTRPCPANHISPTAGVCPSCLYEHIFTILSKDITSQVTCPMQGCSLTISTDVIESILARFNPDYVNEYRTKSTWHGTSEEWVKKFAAHCPYCSVPIEKNGGCNQVVCTRCTQRFDWQLAKTSKFYPYSARLQPRRSQIRTLFIRLMMVFLTLFLTFILVCAGKLIPSIGTLLMNLPGLFNVFQIGFFK